ncbi:hypothetical protein NJ959_23345 [Symplocastrum sp. BBK-W-15]|uniref:vWA-MoxR associated protein N-terminal HTH domain-containing protein n=2 Tax=Limnofasciculus TaxID=3064905 RepID=A0AAE3GVE2_9CYAN|nr:hypothetical protein [Limnofasciculus baicalensis BBK-W-15]
MDIPQILQFVDEAIYTKKDKHLNDLQRRIIAGILKRQKYANVSETYGYSADHVKKISHELLQMLSDVFGEQVKKSNLESVLERQINQKITAKKTGNKSAQQNIISIGYINSCPTSSTANLEKSEAVTPDFQQQSQNPTKIEKIDKLRKFGLSDEEIAEVLEISLDLVTQVDLDE